MSLTIALTATDGLVLAADSRTTEGYTLEGPKIKDDTIKFIQLNEHWGVLTYGLSDIGCQGITALKETISKNLGNVALAFLLKESTHIFYKVSSDWSKNNSKVGRRDKDVGFVIGGYDREDKTVKVFHFQSPDFLNMRLNGRCLLGGQWHIAKFLVKKIFPEDARIDTLKALAVFLLDATMTVEKTVGGAIRLATVTVPKGFQWMSEGEIKDLSAVNRPRIRLFQEQFYTSLLSVSNGQRKESKNSDVYKG